MSVDFPRPDSPKAQVGMQPMGHGKGSERDIAGWDLPTTMAVKLKPRLQTVRSSSRIGKKQEFKTLASPIL